MFSYLMFIKNPIALQTLKVSAQLLPQISKILKLNRLQEVVFGVILLSSSHPELRIHAKTYTRLKFPDLISSFLDTGMSTINPQGHLI